MKCPSCGVEIEQAGRTYKCERCHGAWVRADVLVPMLEQSTSSLVTLPWQTNDETHLRPCPECGTNMQSVKLGTVALDRCEPHGVWFDRKELAALFKQAKQFRATPHHEGILRTLAKLFD
jgi:Zn-finger nucleic acid-binding protein